MLFNAASLSLGPISIVGFRAEERGRASMQSAHKACLIMHDNDPIFLLKAPQIWSDFGKLELEFIISWNWYKPKVGSVPVMSSIHIIMWEKCLDRLHGKYTHTHTRKYIYTYIQNVIVQLWAKGLMPISETSPQEVLSINPLWCFYYCCANINNSLK